MRVWKHFFFAGLLLCPTMPRAAAFVPPVPRVSGSGLSQAAEVARGPSRTSPGPLRRGPESEPFPGTYRLLAILMQFPLDEDASTTGSGVFGDVLDANEAIYGDLFPGLLEIPHDASYFREQLRYLGQYYEAVSYGKLRIEAVVLDSIFEAPFPMAHYGQDDDATRWQAELLRDAVALADPIIDFSSCDGVLVFHAGVGEETDILGDSPGDVWTAYLALPDLASALADSGTEESYRGIPTDDRTGVNDTFFVTEGILLPESETQDEIGGQPSAQWVLGVAAHMMGRLLGAPSLFDTDLEDGTPSQGIGSFGIMGTGLWNSGGILPPHPCAWTKVFFGWADPIVVTRDTTIALPLVERADSEPKIVKVPITEDEYYLIENRYKDENGDSLFNFDDANGDGILYPFEDSYEGAEFDWSLPSEGSIEGSGLLIWHIDEAKIRESGDFRARNAVNADAHRKGVDLEEADGIQDLDVRATSLDNFGSALDSWRADVHARFGPDTAPNTSANYGARTGITIDVESAAESVMTLSISFRERPEGWPVLAPPGIRLVGPVIPVGWGGKARFAYATADTLLGASYGNLIGTDGKPVSGWPVRLPGDVSFAPVVGGAFDLLFPLADGSIVRVEVDGSIDTSGVWGNPYPGTDGHLLSSGDDPTGPLISLLAGPEGTTVVWTDLQGALRDSIAFLEGRAMGPAALWGKLLSFVTTDAGSLYQIYWPEVSWELEVGATPSAAVLLGYQVGATLAAQVAVLTEHALTIGEVGEAPSLRPVVAETGASVTGAPALADIDEDGAPEILFGTEDGRLQARNVTGAPSTGWPLRLGGGPRSDPYDVPIGSPAARDLDGDGKVDVVFATRHGSVVVADGDGRIAPGFPVSTSGTSRYGVTLTRSLEGDTTFVIIPSDEGNLDLLVFPSSSGRVEWAGYANGTRLMGLYKDYTPVQPGGEGLLVEKETFCYPNPVLSGGIARIHYRVRREAFLSVRIYAVDGSIVEEFPETLVPAETGEIVWDTRDVGSGVYTARIQARRVFEGGPDAASVPREETKFLTIAVTR